SFNSPELTPFPTRRSSDLQAHVRPEGYWRRNGRVLLPREFERSTPFGSRIRASVQPRTAPRSLSSHLHKARQALAPGFAKTLGGDRKSTRLNSSHLGSSYA